MAQGDISKRLISIIRDKLRDNAKKIIPNDELIIDLLNRYQNELMLLYDIKKEIYEITIKENQTEYDISPRIKRVLRAFCYNDDLEEKDYELDFDLSRNKVIIKKLDSETVDNGDKIYIEVFIKPVYNITINEQIYDDSISTSKDPIIPEIYHYYLTDLVINDIKGDYKVIEYIKNIIKNLSRFSNGST